MRRTALVNTLGMVTLAFALVGIYAGAAEAQTLPTPGADDQLGLQPYQSYDAGDIDVIGLSNGTVSLDLPFLSYPQRGALKFSFNMIYSNQPQHVGNHCITINGQQHCNMSWSYTAVPTSPLPVDKGDVAVAWAQQYDAAGVNVPVTITTGWQQYNVYYANWSLVAADGAKHPLGNLGTLTLTQPGNYYQGSGAWRSLDASGWLVNGALTAGAGSQVIGTPNSIVGPDGVMYQVQGSGGTVIPEEDSNGNEITQTSTGWLDSLGRAIPSPPWRGSASNVSLSECPQGPLAIYVRCTVGSALAERGNAALPLLLCSSPG
jgi:hypothetical protein